VRGSGQEEVLAGQLESDVGLAIVERLELEDLPVELSRSRHVLDEQGDRADPLLPLGHLAAFS
jgi:hypothetical protein